MYGETPCPLPFPLLVLVYGHWEADEPPGGGRGVFGDVGTTIEIGRLKKWIVTCRTAIKRNRHRGVMLALSRRQAVKGEKR